VKSQRESAPKKARTHKKRASEDARSVVAEAGIEARFAQHQSSLMFCFFTTS
jgi:hypothetical protein